MTQMEALELAMRLAHTAPNLEKSTACLEMAWRLR